MKRETFFEKFDELAETPDGVKSMRELVLRLAFSGGLTGKRPTEVGVPDGWENRTIESISASISSGFACSRSHQVENGHVHLRTHNISTLGTLNFDLLVRIDPKMVDPQKSSIRAGDILFNNTNSQELVGKTSLVDRNYDYGFSNHITRIRLKEGIYPGFVVFYLTLLRNSGHFARLCTRWINQAAVNTDTLKEQTIPLPPLAEQKRIVAKVDELMALCDRLEAQQQEREMRHAALARASLARFADAPTPGNLNLIFHPSFSVSPANLRKSILTLAVQGKLVPQDPNEGTGDEVLSALLQRKFESKEKISSSDGTDEDSLPFSIPSSWALARLGQIYTSSFYGPRFAREEYVKEGGIPTIRTTDMTPRGQIVLRNPPLVRVDDPRKMALYAVRPNDLLVTRSGTIGMMAVFKDDYAAIPSAYLIRLRFPPEVMADFYFLFLGSPHGNDLLGLSLRSIGVPNVNATSISKFVAPIPPLAEQRRIVAKVEQLMALVDALEQQLAASRATGEKLLEALVAELTAA